MNCSYFEKTEAFHDGMLDPEEGKRTEQHIAQCQTCQEYLALLKIKDREIINLGKVRPVLKNRTVFAREVLERIDQRKAIPVFSINRMADSLRSLLLQPALRYAFIIAAIFLSVMFGYQHYILVSKIDVLSSKIETISIENASPSRQLDRMEIISKIQRREQTPVSETEQLIRSYANLQLKYGLLVKSLKIRHPDVYEDLKQIIEEVPESSITKKEISYENL